MSSHNLQPLSPVTEIPVSVVVLNLELPVVSINLQANAIVQKLYYNL